MKLVVLRRSSIALLCAALLVVVMQGPAAAHTVSNTAYNYGNQTDCHTTRSQTLHSGDRGYVKTRGTAYLAWESIECYDGFDRPAGNLYAAWALWKETNGLWGYCTGSGPIYNSSYVSSIEVSSGLFGSTPPCGAGFYENRGGSAHFAYSSWRGNYSVGSGSHALPPCLAGPPGTC